MFRAELTCKSCEFVSDPFIIGYHPPSDSVDFVFQNLVDSSFRVVSCGGIAHQSGNATPTEQELDAVVENLSLEIKQEDEELLDVWVTPDEFPKRKCPKCHGHTVTLNLLSIV